MTAPAPLTLPEAIALARSAVEEATDRKSAASEQSRLDIAQAASAYPADIDLLFLAFQFHFRSGNLLEAERLARTRLDLSPPQSEHAARALCNLGLIAHRQSRFKEAETLFEQALHIDRAIGNLEGVARDLGNLALVPESLGDLDRAEALNHESLALARSLPGPHAEDIAAGKLANLGDIAHVRGNRDEARELWQQAQAIFRRLGIMKWDEGLTARIASVSPPPA